MVDKRSWFQKFFDQCSFGSQYIIHLSPEQADGALNTFLAYSKKDWRTKNIIGALQDGTNSMTVINGQRIVTVKLDTSDALRLKDVVGFTKGSIQSRVEDSGFFTTTTTFPKGDEK